MRFDLRLQDAQFRFRLALSRSSASRSARSSVHAHPGPKEEEPRRSNHAEEHTEDEHLVLAAKEAAADPGQRSGEQQTDGKPTNDAEHDERWGRHLGDKAKKAA